MLYLFVLKSHIMHCLIKTSCKSLMRGEQVLKSHSVHNCFYAMGTRFSTSFCHRVKKTFFLLLYFVLLSTRRVLELFTIAYYSVYFVCQGSESNWIFCKPFLVDTYALRGGYNKSNLIRIRSVDLDKRWRLKSISGWALVS